MAREEDFTTEAAEGQRDRRFHGGAPQRLDDDELARRTEEERVDAGTVDYDPDDVPPATDEAAPTDLSDSALIEDIEGLAARQEDEGETEAPNPFPPTRYDES